MDTSDLKKSSYKSKFKKSYAKPCLYTTFKILFGNSNTLELKGEVFQKLILAVEYDKNLSIDSHSIQKLFPNFSNVAANQKVNNNNSSNVTANEDNQRRLQQGSSSQFKLHQNSLQNCITKPNNQQIQTVSFASESLKRFQIILSGPHSGIFCQIMDMFLSGYGNLLVDSDVLFVPIVYKEKKKILQKIFSTKQSFKRVRASYEAQIESNQQHSFLQFLFHYQINEKQKYKISHTKWSFVFVKVDF